MDGNVKGCQKKVSKFLLHQAILLLQNWLLFIFLKKAVELEGNFLKQDNKFFTHANMVNGLIVYQLHTCSCDLNTDFILKDCLFSAVKLTTNANPKRYSNSAYGIGFDSHSLFLI